MSEKHFIIISKIGACCEQLEAAIVLFFENEKPILSKHARQVSLVKDL